MAEEIKETTQEKKSSGVSFYVPSTIGGKPSIEHFTSKDGKELASVKLPKNTTIVDVDGNVEDASYYTFVVTDKSVRDNRVFVPTENKEGEPFEINLRKENGHWDDPETKKNWVVEEPSILKVHAGVLAEAVKAAREANAPSGYYLSVPKQIKDRDMIKHFTGKDGREWVQVTMPPHTTVKDKDGNEIDGAYMSFVVTDKSVRELDSDPAYYQVFVPKANKDGEDFEISLSRDYGHWDDPETKQNWISDIKEVRVSSAELKNSLDAYRDTRRNFAAEKHESQEKAFTAPQPEAQSKTSTVSEDIKHSQAQADSFNAAKKSPEKTQSR